MHEILVIKRTTAALRALRQRLGFGYPRLTLGVRRHSIAQLPAFLVAALAAVLTLAAPGLAPANVESARESQESQAQHENPAAGDHAPQPQQEGAVEEIQEFQPQNDGAAAEADAPQPQPSIKATPQWPKWQPWQ